MSDLDYTAAYLAKAERTLASARTLLSIEDAEDAYDRDYYAMFNAAHAVLYAAGFGERTAAINTHPGLLSFFGQKIVGTERLMGEYGRDQQGRTAADFGGSYGRSAFDGRGEGAVRAAGDFLEAVRAMVSP